MRFTLQWLWSCNSGAPPVKLPLKICWTRVAALLPSTSARYKVRKKNNQVWQLSLMPTFSSIQLGGFERVKKSISGPHLWFEFGIKRLCD